MAGTDGSRQELFSPRPSQAIVSLSPSSSEPILSNTFPLQLGIQTPSSFPAYSAVFCYRSVLQHGAQTTMFARECAVQRRTPAGMNSITFYGVACRRHVLQAVTASTSLDAFNTMDPPFGCKAADRAWLHICTKLPRARRVSLIPQILTLVPTLIDSHLHLTSAG